MNWLKTLWSALTTKSAPVEMTAYQGQHLGANEDTRSDTEKQSDQHFGEIVAGASVASVTWLKKVADSWRKFPVFNQDGSSSCVANTLAKILGILRWLQDGVFVHFSPAHVYRRRVNFPGEGMIGDDAFKIGNEGVTLDAIAPSDNLSEAQMNAVKVPEYGIEVSELFKLADAKPILLPIGDIETAASVIQKTGKPLMLWFFFTYREWAIANGVAGDWNRPKVLDSIQDRNGSGVIRHSITGVDFTLTEDGKKAIVCEDSAPFGGFVRRVIDEDFFLARNFYAAYPMALKTVQVVSPTDAKVDPTRPRYTFTKPLSFIPWNPATNAPADPTLHAAQKQDVIELQTILKYEGHFPQNIECTGYYGAITCKAVQAGQMAHNVDTALVLEDLKGERFGAKSIAAYNAIYGV